METMINHAGKRHNKKEDNCKQTDRQDSQKGGNQMKKTAVVLAGGGSRGAYQIGAWKAMRELGID